MEILFIIYRFMFSSLGTCSYLKRIFSLRSMQFIFIFPLFCSSIVQAAYIQVTSVEQSCTQIVYGDHITLTCTPVVKVQNVWVSDPVPPPSPSAPPPPPNCDAKKAQSNLDDKICLATVAGIKGSSESICSGKPVTSTKELSPELAASIGADGKLVNGNLAVKVGGKVMEEYHPQADCLRESVNAVNSAQARCDVNKAKRELVIVQSGCPK